MHRSRLSMDLSRSSARETPSRVMVSPLVHAAPMGDGCALSSQIGVGKSATPSSDTKQFHATWRPPCLVFLIWLALAQLNANAADTYLITLEAVQGFCSAEGGGGGMVRCNRSSAALWEEFFMTIPDGGSLASGSEVCLQAQNGQYVTAENGGGSGSVVNANRNACELWERWVIVTTDGHREIRTGEYVSLRTLSKGTYLSSNGGGTAQATADRVQAQAWEQFRISLSPVLSGFGSASASQRAVLRVERDIFKNGRWYFRFKSPNPYDDGYNYGEGAVNLALGEVIPAGSIVTSAVLSWKFTNLEARTNDSLPLIDPPTSDSARRPRVHGSERLCLHSNCTPADVGYWAPDAAFWASRVQVEGHGLYWFPGPPRAATGSLDLLSVFPASALPGRTLSFFGTVQYGVGRPFFDTEGRNCDTELNVLGDAQVRFSAAVSVTYTQPTPTATPMFAPNGGTFSGSQLVIISDETPGAIIYYTTNGSTPSTSSTPYTGPFEVNTSQEIKAIAVAPGYSQSAVAVATFVIERPTVSEIVPDAHSIILDHFNGATEGVAAGSVIFGPSLPGLNDAIDLTYNSYVKYRVPVTLESQATVDFKIKPRRYGIGLVNGNWNNSSSYPPSGHVLHVQLRSDGRIEISGWAVNPACMYSLSSAAAIPLGEWSHVAISWGDETKIYINGEIAASSPQCFRPASPTYMYLAYWGANDVGLFDEFHVSNTQRTDAEIASYAEPVTAAR